MIFPNLRRIQNEIKMLSQNSEDHLDIFRIEPDTADISSWGVYLNGPPGSLYEGYVFHLTVVIPGDYPNSAPHVFFNTKIHHVNINTDGDICLDILKMFIYFEID